MKTTLRAVIKQLKTIDLDERSIGLLDACFPEFRGSQQVSQWLAEGGIEMQMTSKGAIPATSGRMRRYAGDASLPGGRYFALCNNDSGWDGGTLVWELMSYWTSDSEFFPELIDSSVHIDSAQELRKQIDWLGDKPFLLLKAYDIQDASSERIELGNATGIVMPLNIVCVEISDVLDLRTRASQDWFAHHFGEMECELGKQGVNVGGSLMRTLKDVPGSFKEILPTILAPNAGGLAFHEGVGAWLRSNAYNGLVFPSARRNCSVTCNDAEALEFDGWNFVDYRGAGPASYAQFFGLQPHWLKEHQTGVEITDWEDSAGERHWRIEGNEEGERRRYDLEWKRRAGNFHSSVVQDSRYGARED